MLTTVFARRIVAPLLMTGLLTSTTLVAAPEASAAVSSQPASLAKLPDPVSPYRIVPGVQLRAKPPPWVLPVEGYHLTGRFGAASGLWSSTHTGLDFAAAPLGSGTRLEPSGTARGCQHTLEGPGFGTFRARQVRPPARRIRASGPLRT